MILIWGKLWSPSLRRVEVEEVVVVEVVGMGEVFHLMGMRGEIYTSLKKKCLQRVMTMRTLTLPQDP